MAYRYLGNKTRLAPWLVSVISDRVRSGGSIADPMCGTGAVAEALACSGYSVAAADSLTFPTVHARARLLIQHEPPFESAGGYSAALHELNDLRPIRGYFHRELGADGEPVNGSKPRQYFTGENAGRIDAMRMHILRMREAGETTELEHTLLLHNLILAANDVANIAGTYGYYRSVWSNAARATISLSPSQFSITPGKHTVQQGNVEDLASTLAVDAVYLDPPYTKRQYGGNYHVLETLACEDEPQAVGEGGLRDWYPQSSDFCSKRFAANAFREVLKRLDVPHLFISYSEDGLIRSDELEMLLAEYGKVQRHDYPLSRYRSNSGGRGGTVSEYLYHVEATS